MDARAPAVVAVVVTTGAAPGLEQTLASIAAQDYAELSVLVIANGGDADTAGRVAAQIPTAFVRVLEENRGFAAACNEAVLMVHGAAFLLFCHDDVKLYEGAIHQLVEAAYRTNAGIVTPKVVDYEDPFVLVHVGQMVDRFGTVRERIELGEIDHGQQDLERDVFVAPGGVTLVRTDLFETLHGFDPLIPALGEDLDPCWRAQIAGARIIVAPAAVVAHRQTLATGERAVTAVGVRQASRRELQRRHQLATVLTCWTRHTLTLVVPAMVAFDAGELLVSVAGRDVERMRAIGGAWRWVWRNRRHLRQRRRELAAVRVLRDAEVIQLQSAGAHRLRTFMTTLVREGVDHARGVLPDVVSEEERDRSHEGAGFASAFSEDEDFDEVELGVDRPHRWGRSLTSAPAQLTVLAGVVVVWLVGVRGLVATPLPNVGRLAPLDSWWTTWRHFFASWSPNGVGTGTPGMPGYGVLGFFGTFVVGRMGALPRAALIAALPVGAYGMWRLLRGVASNRARLIGAIAYLAYPVGANLVAAGRVDVLVVAGILPFALRRVLALVNVPGFALTTADPVPFGHRGWGRTRAGQVTVLVAQTAIMSALNPAALVIVVLAVLATAVAVTLGGGRADRPWGLAANVTLGTAVLLLPLTFDTVAAGPSMASVFGLRAGPWTAMSMWAIARGATGPFGAGWAAWLVPAIAVVALLLARGERRALARIFGALGAMAALLVALVGRDWLGDFAPDQSTVMVAIAVAVAGLVAVTVSAIETDVAGVEMRRWRQVLAGGAVLAIVAMVIPLAAQSADGRLGLPTTGTPETLGTVTPSAQGGYRILWLGEPYALPVGGWSVAPGLAAATTTNSLPAGATLFTPPTVAAMAPVLAALRETLSGGTVELGQLLAPEGISTVVVMTADAPTLGGLQRVRSDEPPAPLVPSLDRQGDLGLTAHTPGVFVFTNDDFHGIIAQRGTALRSTESATNPDSTRGWAPVLATATQRGVVSAGTVLAGLAPASAFDLSVNGRDVPRSTSLGGMAVFSTSAGVAAIVLHQAPYNALLGALTLALWVMVGLGFGGLDALGFLARRRHRLPEGS